MNNKKGGFGTKFVLILILMLASAAGGAYAYRVLDGKMAVREANKVIERVDLADYDNIDAPTVQDYIEKAKKDLEIAKTRKEAYEIMFDFNEDISKVMTSAQKELKAAREANQTANLPNTTENENQSGNLFGELFKDDNANTDNNTTDSF